MEEQKNDEMKGTDNHNSRQDCGHFRHFGHHCNHKFACLKGAIVFFTAFLLLFIGLGIGFKLGHLSSERNFRGYERNNYGQNCGCPMMDNAQGDASCQTVGASGFTAGPMIRVQESGQIPVTVSRPATLAAPTSSAAPVNTITHSLKK